MISSKFLISTIILYVSTALVLSLAATADQKINKRIDFFQTQINQLRKQRKQSQEKSIHTHHYRKHICLNSKCVYHTSRLETGSCLNTQETVNESKLIINIPTVREDARILLRQYQLEQECLELGTPIPAPPPLPKIIFSGKLEGQIAYGRSYGSSYAESKVVNINFSAAELDTYVQGNSWVSGYIALDYDSDELMDRSRVFMNHAFVTIGNLRLFPFYASIGQVYVAFGRYSSLMITAPVTLELGRTRSRALTIGYQQTGKNILYAEVYGYQALTNNLSHSHQNNQWGANVGYEFNISSHCPVSGELGASFISNLADSKGMQTTVFLHDKTLHHTIQAIDFYGRLTADSVVFIAEYVGVLRSFNIADVSFANQSACPNAFHTEVSYMFHTGSKSSSIGVGYGHTTQALVLGLPQDRYSVFYGVDIWRDTHFTLEYRHDINYSRNAASTTSVANPIPSDITTNVGKSVDIMTAQFNFYF